MSRRACVKTCLRTAAVALCGRKTAAPPKVLGSALRTYPRTAAGALCGRRSVASPKVLGSALKVVGVAVALLATAIPLGAAELLRQDTTETRYGAHRDNDGWVHFVVHSPEAADVQLLLFNAPEADAPWQQFPMTLHGTDWKLRLKGPSIGPGLRYMYSASGKNEVGPADQFGLMFNRHFFLNDPYAYQTDNVRHSTFFRSTPYSDITAPVYSGGGKSVVYDHSADSPPGHVAVAAEDLIVYELHVQDFTVRIALLDPSGADATWALPKRGSKRPAARRRASIISSSLA